MVSVFAPLPGKKFISSASLNLLLLIFTVLAHNWSSNWMEHNTPPNKGFCMTVNGAASFRSTAWMFFVFLIMKWIFSLKQSVKKIHQTIQSRL